MHRLEKKEWVSSYSATAETGRKRKYYKLNKAGLEALNAQRQNWQSLYTMIKKLEGGTACSI